MAIDPMSGSPTAPPTNGNDPHAPSPAAPTPTNPQVPPAPNGPIPTSDPNNPPIQPAPAPTTDHWSGADDELKAFIGTKTPLDIAKELKGAQALIGKKTVGVPGENSTPEEQAAFHKARGVPEKGDDYKFDDVLSELTKDLPEGLITADPEREKQFREMARASNLSNTEARELMKRQLGAEIEARKATAAASQALQQKTNDLVTQTWGTKKDEFTQDANNFLRHVGIDDDALKVVNSALGANPEARMKFLDFARQQGMMLREGGKMHGAQAGAVISTMTPDQARVAKQEYIAQGDNREAYMNPQHKNHKMVTDQMTQYLRAERGVK